MAMEFQDDGDDVSPCAMPQLHIVYTVRCFVGNKTVICIVKCNTF